jgi:hypothetical protein
LLHLRGGTLEQGAGKRSLSRKEKDKPALLKLATHRKRKIEEKRKYNFPLMTTEPFERFCEQPEPAQRARLKN